MDTRIPRPRSARAFSLAAMIALFAMLLPAAAGVALGHTASGTCDSITLSNSPLNANIYVYGTSTLVMTVAGDHTYTIPAGNYQVVWTDGVRSGEISVGKCSATITTVANPNTGTVGVAMTVGDTATLSAPVTFVTGTSVTFTLYSNNTCTTSTGVTGSGSLNGSGIATYSTSWTPSAAGSYYWKASFPGDTYNNSYVSACGGANETLTVGMKSPTLGTTQSADGLIGTVLNDTATLAGGYSPTGSITFQLYGPGTSCTTTAIYTQTVVLSGSSAATSSGFTTTAVGTYEWTASYSGDANNKAASSDCGAEAVVITQKNSPTIATTLSESSGTVGDAVQDSATITGATSTAGGTVKYTVYTNSQCTLGAQDAGTKTVTNHLVPNSNSITFNSTGTWYWQAVYSGDGNNAGATSTCTEETLVIDPTPFQFQGETATPTGAATSTPFQIFQGETATPRLITTPPPTNTGGDGSTNSSTPLFALLICLAAGGLGLAAVEAQRRSIRR